MGQLLGCDAGEVPEQTGAEKQGSTLDAFLYQGKTPCEYGIECASRVCEFGTCAGVLSTDDEGAQSVILEALSGAVEEGVFAVETVEGTLKGIVERVSGDPLVRVRAARALAALSTERLIPLFESWLKAETPLKYWGAIGLAKTRPKESLVVLKTFLGARSEAIVIRTLEVMKSMDLTQCPQELGVLACEDESPRIRETARGLMVELDTEPSCPAQ